MLDSLCQAFNQDIGRHQARSGASKAVQSRGVNRQEPEIRIELGPQEAGPRDQEIGTRSRD